MRAASLFCVLFIFGGCSEETNSDPVAMSPTVDVAALVKAAASDCAKETANADPNLGPGAYEVCLAKKANTAPIEARAAICSEAKNWAGYMVGETCNIDPE